MGKLKLGAFATYMENAPTV